MRRLLAACGLLLACTIAAHGQTISDDRYPFIEHSAGAVHKHPAAHRVAAGRRSHRAANDAGDPRPGKWCGWMMRQWFSVRDRTYNLAREWARYGTDAGGPAIGAIVVWTHHVGVIAGKGARGWIVRSGNDGGRVRERERSVAGAIAFRWPPRMASL